MVSPTIWSKSWAYVLLLGVVLIAFAVRLYGLNKDSLWFDEIGQVLVAQGSLWQTITGAARHEGSTPLDYVITHLTLYFGDTEVMLRLPPVLWGTSAVLVLYGLGSLLVDRSTALVAAFMLALSPFHIFYSQEVRFYSLATLMALLSCYTFLLAVRNERRRRFWLLYGVVHLLALYTHYYVLLLTLAQGGWLALRVLNEPRLKRSAWLFGCASGLAVALFLPWAFYDNIVVSQGKIGSGSPFALPGARFYLGLFYIPGPLTSWWAWAGGVGLWLLFGVGVVLSTRQSTQQRANLLLPVLVVLVGIPGTMLLNYIGSYWFRERQLLLWMPFILLVISATVMSGIKALAGNAPARRSALHVITTSAPLAFLMLYACYTGTALAYMFRTPLRDDWRSTGQYLVDHVQPGDVILVHTPEHLAFYSDEVQDAITQFPIEMPYDEVETWMTELGQQHERVWVVTRGDLEVGIVRWLKEQSALVATYTTLKVYEYSSP